MIKTSRLKKIIKTESFLTVSQNPEADKMIEFLISQINQTINLIDNNSNIQDIKDNTQQIINSLNILLNLQEPNGILTLKAFNEFSELHDEFNQTKKELESLISPKRIKNKNILFVLEQLKQDLHIMDQVYEIYKNSLQYK